MTDSSFGKALSRRGLLLGALAGGAAISLAACGGDDEQAQPTVEPSPSPTEEGPKPELKKEKVDSLVAIPDDADLIVASSIHREVGPFGKPAVELYAVNSETGQMTRLTHTLHSHNHFAVSFDRRYIACNRYIHGDTNGNGQLEAYDRKTLYVIDLQTKEEWQLVPELETGWGGISWGPDGFIYCSMSKLVSKNSTDIHRIRPDGTGFKNLTADLQLEKLLGHDTPNHWVSDTGCAWDGKTITFLYHKDMLVKKTEIGWMKLDGSEARVVTDGGPLPPGPRGPWSVGDFDPELSPDGKAVCYQRVTDVGYNYSLSTGIIGCSNVDGSRVWQASPESMAASTFYIPHWSQDDWIVCTEMSAKDAYWGPAIFRPDGSEYRRVTGANGCTHARWLPKA